MEKGGWVYIMANRYRGGMYVGVTSDLTRRVWQHREGDGSIHVTDFGKTRLVYAERHDEIEPAIAREKLDTRKNRVVRVGLVRGGLLPLLFGYNDRAVGMFRSVIRAV
ncbi:GIY-YIG nuclease family protein [Novosphingobium sp. AAP83]|uniref:GIY-YIG nuclease family protein n=1 Tax=Novosphingobium sp. AAP83 TaxID=1523425 RepID=UPI0009EBA6A9|nr:GIY-YIG nuclease family protein [Novosphingobium sp. AAP83]